MKQLNTIVHTLLDPQFPPHTLRPEVMEMAKVLNAQPGSFVRQDDIAKGETQTPKG